jgi:diguanylate cyclase (GGDEF)-like protein
MFLVSDINDRREREKKLIYAAERDMMTGLLNRATTLQRIKSYLARRNSGVCSMYIIDIDNFKSLNDTYGHQTGDKFIEDFAQLLKHCFRDNDIVGRLGGDEFIVLIDGVGDAPMLKRRADAVLRRVLGLCERYGELELSASIGGCIYKEGMDFEQLYARADDALYEAKGNGKNNFVLK